MSKFLTLIALMGSAIATNQILSKPHRASKSICTNGACHKKSTPVKFAGNCKSGACKRR